MEQGHVAGEGDRGKHRGGVETGSAFADELLGLGNSGQGIGTHTVHENKKDLHFDYLQKIKLSSLAYNGKIVVARF